MVEILEHVAAAIGGATILELLLAPIAASLGFGTAFRRAGERFERGRRRRRLEKGMNDLRPNDVRAMGRLFLYAKAT